MSARNKYSLQQIRHARQVALRPYLEKMGYPMQSLQNGNTKVYDLPMDIIVKETYWVCPATGQGGNAIDLLTHVMGMSFSEAMDALAPFSEPHPS